ncbi:MAG: sigma-54-dependent transcriptional regulator, partial [Desulfomonilaceae bacterium]
MNDSRGKILVVDDEPHQRRKLKANLVLDGYQIFEACYGKEAINWVSQEFFDLILIDECMIGLDGIETLREIKKISPSIPVIILASNPSVDAVIEAWKAGAHDYIARPLMMEELRHSVQQTVERWRSPEPTFPRVKIPDGLFDKSLTILRSKKMKEVLETIARVAPAEATVLISGPPGTEKELIADALHEASNRADHKIVKINCSA